MVATPEFYATLLDEADLDGESFTCLVVTGGTRESVAAALGVDLTTPFVNRGENPDVAGYAIAEITGGVVAIELTGYADPSIDTLVALSRGGHAAAVFRSNIQAHERFGCARDGVLLFDDDEYVFLEAEDKQRVPGELRALFDLAWIDLDEDDAGDDAEDALAVGLAMAEVVTGLELTPEDLTLVEESGFFAAPSLVYVHA